MEENVTNEEKNEVNVNTNGERNVKAPQISVILGILSIIFSFSIFLGILLGIIGLVLGIHQRVKLGKILNIIGLTLSFFALIIGGIGAFLWIEYKDDNTTNDSLYYASSYKDSSSTDAPTDTTSTDGSSIDTSQAVTDTNVSDTATTSIGKRRNMTEIDDDGSLNVLNVSDFTPSAGYSQPRSGNKFIIVSFEITNIDDDDGFYVSDGKFSVESAQSAFDRVIIYPDLKDSTILNNSYILQWGATKSHKLIFEVPANETIKSLHFKSGDEQMLGYFGR